MKAKQHSLRESVICTAVFALIFTFITACGGNIIPPVISGLQHTTAAIRSFTRTGSSIGASPSGHVSIAAFFAVAPVASTLPESWQAGCADLANKVLSTPARYALMTTENGNPCGDVNGGTTNGVLMRDSPTATDVPNGPSINFDGTLSAVVVTAQVDGAGELKCRDVTASVTIHDGDHIQPWYDTQTNTILFTSEHALLATTCALPNVPTGAVVHKVVIKFAKQ